MNKKLARDPLDSGPLNLILRFAFDLFLNEGYPLSMRAIRIVDCTDDAVTLRPHLEFTFAQELGHYFRLPQRHVFYSSLLRMVAPMFEASGYSWQKLNQRLGAKFPDHQHGFEIWRQSSPEFVGGTIAWDYKILSDRVPGHERFEIV